MHQNSEAADLGIRRAAMFRQMLMSFVSLLLAAVAFAAESDRPVKHRILFFEYGNTQNRLVELDADGKIVWEHRPPSLAVIFDPLPNGHVLYAYGGKPTGVVEIDA